MNLTCFKILKLKFYKKKKLILLKKWSNLNLFDKKLIWTKYIGMEGVIIFFSHHATIASFTNCTLSHNWLNRHCLTIHFNVIDCDISQSFLSQVINLIAITIIFNRDVKRSTLIIFELILTDFELNSLEKK